jgi:hypothetical protein
MSKTESTREFLATLLEIEAPHLAGRVRVEMGATQKLFEARPLGSGAVLTFGRQTPRSPMLCDVLEEAVAACEAIIYQTSRAVSIRLDAHTRWCYEQRQLPCTD